MELIILIIALGALFLAMAAYRGPFFEPRFEIYEELIMTFAQFLELKYNSQQLHKLDRLILRAKFLYNYDKDVLYVLNRTRDYLAFFLEHKHEDKSHGEKVAKKEHEMVRWIEQVTSKNFVDEEDRSELDKIFDCYLKVSLLVEVPPILKDMGSRIVEFFQQWVEKIKGK